MQFLKLLIEPAGPGLRVTPKTDIIKMYKKDTDVINSFSVEPDVSDTPDDKE